MNDILLKQFFKMYIERIDIRAIDMTIILKDGTIHELNHETIKKYLPDIFKSNVEQTKDKTREERKNEKTRT